MSDERKSVSRGDLARLINRFDCIVGDGERPNGIKLGLDYGTAEEWADAIFDAIPSDETIHIVLTADAGPCLEALARQRSDGSVAGLFLMSMLDDWFQTHDSLPRGTYAGMVSRRLEERVRAEGTQRRGA